MPGLKTARKQSKVRTGCLRCKSRRVKCGEEKPSCARCLKRGEDCHYKTSTSGPYDPETTLRRAVPYTVNARVSSNPQIQSTAAFRNESEFQYFQLFSRRTSTALSSVFSTQLWEEKIPFLAVDGYWDAPYIRHAAIALAALDKASLTTSDEPNVSKEDAMRSAKEHRRYALEHYQSALKGLRLWLTTEIRDEDVSKVLMAILLMIYFEAGHAKSEAVLFHTESGLKIIEQTLLRNPSRPIRYAPNSPPNIIDGELILLFCFLGMQTGSKLPIRHPKLFEGDAMEQIRGRTPRVFTDLKESSYHMSMILISSFSLKRGFAEKLADDRKRMRHEDAQARWVEAQRLELASDLTYVPSGLTYGDITPKDRMTAAWIQLRSQTGLTWPLSGEAPSSQFVAETEMHLLDKPLRIIIERYRKVLEIPEFRLYPPGKKAVKTCEQIMGSMNCFISSSENPQIQEEARMVVAAARRCLVAGQGQSQFAMKNVTPLWSRPIPVPIGGIHLGPLGRPFVVSQGSAT